jgi:hypothetical protein
MFMKIRSRTSLRRIAAIKLVAASCLLVLAWSYRPVSATCPEGAELYMVCYTEDEYGNQSCMDDGLTHGDYYVSYCQLVELPGPYVYVGCNGGACHP